MKIFALLIGIGYAYILFLFIPKRIEKEHRELEPGYYVGAVKQLVIYIIAYIAYTYFYDWLKGFFIK